ncbi:MAG: twin-arginine translocase subunit TatC [Lachnospiraceae bacterium]|nr:twin-arginine translocase subunit TatC [Lachnospiraceae bacterium]
MKKDQNAAKQPASKKQEKDKSEDGKMTITGHLKEFRNRLAVCLVGLVIAFLIALYFSQDIINFLTAMGEKYNYVFVYIAPQELLMQQFTISLVVAVCVMLPLLLYEIWAYVNPALKKSESRLFIGVIISGLICFVVGVFFAYKIMLPFMLRFLIELSSGTNIQASISVQNYLNFEITIFVVMGFIFELPVVAVLLTQLGLIKVEWMKKGIKPAIIVIFLIAAIVTPPDIVSQSMVAIPMLGLYILSIYLSAFLLKFKKKKPETEIEEDSDDDD